MGTNRNVMTDKDTSQALSNGKGLFISTVEYDFVERQGFYPNKIVSWN